MSNKTNRLLKKKPEKNSRKISKTNVSSSNNSILALLAHLKEILLLILFGSATFFLVSLVSYHPLDAGWSRTAQHVKTANIAGNIGAWCADLLLYFFGYLAYLFPIMMLYCCCLILLNKKIVNNLVLWNIRIFGFLVTILSGCSLLSFLKNYSILKTKIVMPVSVGGILGDLLSNYLSNHANFWGSIVILSPCILAGITAISGISWLSLIKLTCSLVNKLVVFISKRIFILLTNFRDIIFSLITKIKELNKKQGAVKKPLKSVNIEKIIKQSPSSIINSSNVSKEVNSQIVLPTVLPPKEEISEQYAAAKNFIKQLQDNKDNTKTNAINRNPINKNTVIKNSNLPSINILEKSSDEDLKYCSENLPDPSNIQEKLADFGIAVQITNIFPGPVVTRIEMELAPGTKASKITSLSKDLARSLSVPSVRVVEVIPGKSVVGLEIPNKNRAIVRLRDILSSEQYLTSSSPLTLALGKDISGVPIVTDLSRMPHLLVAGTTGSGKSVGVNIMLLSMLFKVTASDVRLILIDPKMLELSIYEGIPHLLTPVVTDLKDAAHVLNWCVFEMERRYKLMAHIGVRNLLSFNHKVQSASSLGNPLQDSFYNPNIPESVTNKKNLEKLPYIVIIIDEFADMMMVVGKKVEEQIARIAQKARAAGIHMILATQRPSVDVITGLIKANIPTRIAYQVSSRIDSRTILDQQGAEQLLGHGDLLYLPPGTGIPIRVHGAFVSDDEVHKVVAALKTTTEAKPNNFVINLEQIQNLPEATAALDDEEENDPLYDEAVAIVTSSRKASISYLQRRLKIGFNRAANLIERMQVQGVVSEVQNNGIREVLAGSHD